MGSCLLCALQCYPETPMSYKVSLGSTLFAYTLCEWSVCVWARARAHARACAEPFKTRNEMPFCPDLLQYGDSRYRSGRWKTKVILRI